MNYEIGDTVLLKTQAELEKEFGVDINGDIKAIPVAKTEFKYLGKEQVIKKLYNEDAFYFEGYHLYFPLQAIKYKKLTKYSQLEHGMRVRGSIEGEKFEDGKISINEDGYAYVCQNLSHDWSADDLLGYEYSWWVSAGAHDNDMDATLYQLDEPDQIKQPKKTKETQWTPEPAKYTKDDNWFTETEAHIDGQTMSIEEFKEKAKIYRSLAASHSRYFPSK